MDLEEAKNRIKILLKDDCICEECMKNKDAYKTVLAELEKFQQLYGKALNDVVIKSKECMVKDKMIHEMAKQLAGYPIFEENWNPDNLDEPLTLENEKEVIEYFEKKVEGE